MTVRSTFFFDGETAGGRTVQVGFDDHALIISDGEETRRWNWGDVREMRDQADEREVVFNHAEASEARLMIYDADLIDAIRKHSRKRYKIVVPSGTGKRLTVWTVLALSSVAVIVFLIIPNLANLLTRLVPVEREVQLGDAAMRQIESGFLWSFGDGYCIGEGAPEALDKMAARLTREIDSPYKYKIRGFDSDQINAFAIPGGHIVFFDGLLQNADSPEQVAAVLAHEIAHIENRDSLRLMLRAAGSAGILSTVIGDFAGGALILIIAEQLVSASHSQTTETNADSYATDRLAEAGLPSTPFGDFFDMIHDKYGMPDSQLARLFSYISTHPELEGRAINARLANTVTGDFDPVLSQDDWTALKNACEEVQDLEDLETE